jgi:hypothetical protein
MITKMKIWSKFECSLRVMGAWQGGCTGTIILRQDYSVYLFLVSSLNHPLINNAILLVDCIKSCPFET